MRHGSDHGFYVFSHDGQICDAVNYVCSPLLCDTRRRVEHHAQAEGRRRHRKEDEAHHRHQPLIRSRVRVRIMAEVEVCEQPRQLVLLTHIPRLCPLSWRRSVGLVVLAHEVIDRLCAVLLRIEAADGGGGVVAEERLVEDLRRVMGCNRWWNRW